VHVAVVVVAPLELDKLTVDGLLSHQTHRLPIDSDQLNNINIVLLCFSLLLLHVGRSEAMLHCCWLLALLALVLLWCAAASLVSAYLAVTSSAASPTAVLLIVLCCA